MYTSDNSGGVMIWDHQDILAGDAVEIPTGV